MRVALDFSGRIETVRGPMERVGIECVADADHADALITDTLSRSLLRPSRRPDVPVVYRPRSDILRLWAARPAGRLRGLVHTVPLLRGVDAVIAPDDCVERRFRRLTAAATATVGLPKDVDQWPDASHEESDDLRLLTLTNLDYGRKTRPLLRRVRVIESWCQSHGATWAIAGNGEFADSLAAAVAGCECVSYVGHIDPYRWLGRADVLLHFSHLDIRYPNAILEAMAAGVPVVTNDFGPFKRAAYRHVSGEDELRAALERLLDPDRRATVGRQLRQVVEQAHAPETIGREYRSALQEVAG